MVAQSSIYENESNMVNGNGEGQLAMGDVAISRVEETNTEISLAKQPQEGNAPDLMQWTRPRIFIHAV